MGLTVVQTCHMLIVGIMNWAVHGWTRKIPDNGHVQCSSKLKRKVHILLFFYLIKQGCNLYFKIPSFSTNVNLQSQLSQIGSLLTASYIVWTSHGYLA